MDFEQQEKIDLLPNAQILIDLSSKENYAVYLVAKRSRSSFGKVKFHLFPRFLPQDKKFNIIDEYKSVSKNPIQLIVDEVDVREYVSGKMHPRTFITIAPSEVSKDDANYMNSPYFKLVKPFQEQINGLLASHEAMEKSLTTARATLIEFGSHTSIQDDMKNRLNDALGNIEKAIRIVREKQIPEKKGGSSE